MARKYHPDLNPNDKVVEKKFKEINDANFKRDKDNLHTTIELDFYKSILGGELMVSTFNGKTKLIIEPETKNGTKLKLKGKGFPKYKKKVSLETCSSRSTLKSQPIYRLGRTNSTRNWQS